MRVQLRYFASLREALGPGETIDWEPSGPATVGALRHWLRARSTAAAEVLGTGRSVRVAVDLDMASEDTPLRDGAEVAFFPPVTGG